MTIWYTADTHLGDFSFQSHKYRYNLHGKIILLPGNHDKKKYNYLFDKILNSVTPHRIAEFRVLLSHKPLERLDNTCPRFNICGHVHEKWKVKDWSINIGVDCWNMKPIREDELARFLRCLL